jgi:hypothetical protein
MMGAAVMTALSARDRRALQALLPNMVRGAALLTNILRRRRMTRPVVRAVPTIMRRTVATLKRRAAAGQPITRRAAGRAAAVEVRRVLGSPSACAAAISQNVRVTRRMRAKRAARWPIHTGPVSNGEGGKRMSAAASEYELEVLPELGAGYESEFEGDFESQQFFGALANLARRGAGWMTAPGSPQRQLALSVARRALNRGLPALGQLVGGRFGGAANGAAGGALGSQAAAWLGGLLPQQEYESEFETELEISPIRRIYPDAMLEHLGHAAAETQSEAEAEALAGAMIPLAAAGIPRGAAPILMLATPGLVSGLSGVVHGLRRSPTTRPLVRVVPAIVRSTATNIAQQASRGVPVTPQTAVRTLARQTFRMLGSPQQSARAFRRSRALDGLLHRTYPAPLGSRSSCPSCGARAS